MGTAKKVLTRKVPLSGDVPDYFRTGDIGSSAEMFLWTNDAAAVRSAWEAVRDELLADWIRERPGRRPWGWWRYDAPRWSRKFGAWFDGTLPEPRLRLGGTGTPAFEALAYVPTFARGVPDLWVSDFDVSYYNGRAKDIHGNRIGTKYAEGHFPHQAIDPADPPRFESEASYLKRRGLLLPGELARLTEADFADEVIS